MDLWWSESTVCSLNYTMLEVCDCAESDFFHSCISKLDSCSWYDSWLQKNYRRLLLF